MDEIRELKQVEAEYVGRIPLEPGAYLHVSDPDATEILIIGVAHPGGEALLLD